MLQKHDRSLSADIIMMTPEDPQHIVLR